MAKCSKFFMVLILGILVLRGVGVNRITSAQGEDCGNGLVQRLNVGLSGRVIPEPPQSVNMRDEPGGNLIGQIQPGETFVVVDGPQCHQSYSWWQVETENNQIGWVTEGTDYYFLEPLEVPQITPTEEIVATDNADVSDCEALEPSNLQLGMSVEVVQPEIAFYGHPLIPGALFSQPTDEIEYKDYSGTFLLLEGPYCYNGAYLWNIGDFWLYENNGTEPQIVPADEQPPVNVPFEPRQMPLLLNAAAPIVNPNQQLAFGGAGGGFRYASWETGCALGEVTGETTYYRSLGSGLSVIYGCVMLYPFPEDEMVQITVFRPDGSVAKTLEKTAQSIEVYTDVSDPILFNGVEVEMAHVVGNPAGVWRVEGKTGDFTVTKAYELEPITEPTMRMVCERGVPNLVLQGFEPESTQEIILVKAGSLLLDNEISEAARYVNIGIFRATSIEEVDRWKLEVGEYGELIAPLKFAPYPIGAFILSHENADPNETSFVTTASATLRIDTNGEQSEAIHYGGGEASESPFICPTYTNRTDATTMPIQNGDIVTGQFERRDPVYYTFEGKAGNTVALQAVSLDTTGSNDEGYHDPIDLVITLEDPDGKIIAENDDAAEVSQFQNAPTDSEIRNFVLPEDGIYTIEVSFLNGEDWYGDDVFALIFSIEE